MIYRVIPLSINLFIISFWNEKWQVNNLRNLFFLKEQKKKKHTIYKIELEFEVVTI